jgi:hypothetical protein
MGKSSSLSTIGVAGLRWEDRGWVWTKERCTRTLDLVQPQFKQGETIWAPKVDSVHGRPLAVPSDFYVNTSSDQHPVLIKEIKICDHWSPDLLKKSPRLHCERAGHSIILYGALKAPEV